MFVINGGGKSLNVLSAKGYHAWLLVIGGGNLDWIF